MGGDQDFQGGDPSFPVDSFKEGLGDYGPQGISQGGSNLGLLIGGEDLYDSVHRLGGADVQEWQNQMPCFRSLNGREAVSGLISTRIMSGSPASPRRQ
jgi:hypothetical protein